MFLNKVIWICAMGFMSTGCMAINIADSQGKAKDSIDSAQSPSPTISPTVSIPVSPK